MKGGRPFFMHGFNHWAAGIQSREDRAAGWDQRSPRIWASGDERRARVVRGEGRNDGYPTITLTLQPSKGQFDPVGVAGLHRLVDELERRDRRDPGADELPSLVGRAGAIHGLDGQRPGPRAAIDSLVHQLCDAGVQLPLLRRGGEAATERQRAKATEARARPDMVDAILGRLAARRCAGPLFLILLLGIKRAGQRCHRLQRRGAMAKHFGAELTCLATVLLLSACAADAEEETTSAQGELACHDKINDLSPHAVRHKSRGDDLHQPSCVARPREARRHDGRMRVDAPAAAAVRERRGGRVRGVRRGGSQRTDLRGAARGRRHRQPGLLRGLQTGTRAMPAVRQQRSRRHRGHATSRP